MSEIHEWGVREAARKIAQGEISSSAYVEALLQRSTAHHALNAFVTLDHDAVSEAAQQADLARAAGKPLGPLHGVPITLKDNINTKDQPTTAGTEALRHHRPRADAPVTSALRSAGALVFGKTGMHELAIGITSNNAAFGAIRNPYDPSRNPGGSSGGTAAAVAARLVPGGIGTDTGGSVRIPAALCGIAGLRPTHGRWPGAGIVPITASRDTPGPLARSVDDLALLDEVVTGETLMSSRRPDDLRFAVPRRHFWDDLDGEVRRLCESALAGLREAGVQLIEVDFAAIEHALPDTGTILALYEVGRELRRYLAEEGLGFDFADFVGKVRTPNVSAALRSTLNASTAISHTAYRQAFEVKRVALQRGYQDFFDEHRLDGMVFPTTPVPAQPIGADAWVIVEGRKLPLFDMVIRNTDPGAIAGVPGLSLPIGLTAAELPVGLAIDGRRHNDRDLLAAGLALESIFGRLPAPADLVAA